MVGLNLNQENPAVSIRNIVVPCLHPDVSAKISYVKREEKVVNVHVGALSIMHNLIGLQRYCFFNSDSIVSPQLTVFCVFTL